MSIQTDNISMMKKEKDREWISLSYLILFLVIFFLHILAKEGQQDDSWFATALEGTNLGGFLLYRYKRWSSRVLIEGLLVLLTGCSFWVWRILDSLIMCLGIYSIVELCGLKKNSKSIALVFFLCLLLPLETMRSAGWVATTLNYLWPCSLGLYGMLPIKRFWEGKAFRPWEYVTFTAALLFSANMEQTAALLLGFYLLFSVAYIYRRKKLQITEGMLLPGYAIVILCILSASIIFILTCPGNANRGLEETMTWFPQYADYGLGDKLAVGFLSTMSYYVAGLHEQMILPVFAAVIMFALWDQKKKAGAAAAGVAFLAFTAAGPLIRNTSLIQIWGKYRIYYELLENVYIPKHDLCRYTTGFVVLEGVLFGLVIILLLWELYRLYGKSGKMALCTVALAAGLASRLVVGFSSTIYASGYRTTLFFTVILLMISAVMIDGMKDQKNKAGCLILIAGILALTFLLKIN
ncbi:MAG: DUF6056 family protein [Lachnospiraceae bacterium]